jgi:hypothetical protein
MKRSILLGIKFFIVITLLSIQLFAQKPENGVYFSSLQLIENTPVLTQEKIVLRNNNFTSYKIWFKSDSLYFLNSNYQKTNLNKDSIFAIVDQNIVFVNCNQTLHKVNEFGYLTYFTESYPIVNTAYSPVAIDVTKEVSPKILDLKSNKIVDYSANSLLQLLKEHDIELYLSYKALDSNKKRKQMLYSYLEKYNTKHPLPTFRL